MGGYLIYWYRNYRSKDYVLKYSEKYYGYYEATRGNHIDGTDQTA